MKLKSNTKVIVIGDSTHNTLSAIRSFGEANIQQFLILVCEEDNCFVSKSRYIKDQFIKIKNLDECLPILERVKEKLKPNKPFIICTFDSAANFLDKNEDTLSKSFITPSRGHKLGDLFNKDVQCLLAKECGLTVPNSQIYLRNEPIESIKVDFPIILKPGNSTKGEKEDIHICENKQKLIEALKKNSRCNRFIIQEFIDKEYELDCIGVRNDKETIIAGAVKKIRHYPPIIGAGAYGLFLPLESLEIDTTGILEFLEKSGYYGPFSIELLHKKGKNYFMEVNFRNEGLAYVATAAGANLHAKYIDVNYKIGNIKPIYMMNYALDYLYVKDGVIAKTKWWRDFLRTRAFININFKDLSPTINYYKHKILSKFK